MKKLFSLLAILLCCSIGVQAQNDQGKTDDVGRIVLKPYVVSGTSIIPEYATNVLKNKLAQITAAHGVAGTSLDQRFVITANLVELSKDFTTTTPAMVALTIMPTIYIGDVVTGELYASCGLPEARGVGENETKAYLNAIKRINVNNSAVTQCIDAGKNKIVAFYNSQIDFLLAEAKSLMESERYDEAIFKLAAVPNVCKDAYLKATAKIGEVYQKKIDVEGEKLYNEAVAQWKTAKTKESASRVVELLAEINPLSAAATKSRTLVKEIEAYNAELRDYRRKLEEEKWAFKMQKYQDSIALKQTGLNFDYEIQMEKARNGGKEMAAELALQEVKNTISLMRTNSSNSQVTTTSVLSAATSGIVAKICSWFK